MKRKSTSFKLMALLAIGTITDLTSSVPNDGANYVPDYSEHIAKGWRVYNYRSNDGDTCVWQAVKDIKSFIAMMYHCEIIVGN